MPAPLPAPQIEWRGDHPWSPLHDDGYASEHGARRERESVFLEAHGFSPAEAAHAGRWLAGTGQPLDRVTFGELGFGAGVSFLVTWAAFQAHVLPLSPHALLEWVSVEGAPLNAQQLLRAALSDPAMRSLEPLARELAMAWPEAIPGLHRRVLNAGRVRLTLLFGQPLDLLPRMTFAADAWNLDGFAPVRNPQMWSAEVMEQVALHSCTGTSVASAHPIQTAQARRIMQHPPQRSVRTTLPAWFAQPEPVRTQDAESSRALVIGAGLAGAAAARSLAERGVSVDVIDCSTPASGGSGGPRAIMAPHLASWHGVQARAVAHAFLGARAELQRLNIPHQPCGLLHPLAPDDVWSHEQALAEWGWPQDLLKVVSAQEGAALAGVPLCATTAAQSAPAVWVPLACSAQPSRIVQELLNHPMIQVHPHITAESLHHTERGWHLRRATQDQLLLLHWRTVVLATAGAWTPRRKGTTITVDRTAPLASCALPHVPFDGTRGQLTLVADSGGVHSQLPRTILSAQGFVLPPRDGVVCTGSTHERGNDSLVPTSRDDALNVMAAERLAPTLPALLGAPECGGAWVGLRATVNDHLPVIGAVPDQAAFCAAFAPLCDGPFAAKWPAPPVLPGLYCTLAHGSRGCSTALMAGELLGDIITGAVRCVPDDLLPALLPQRFLVRTLRRGKGAAVP
jgi:tRNA 5-methylaminomethyl-2-thiouridine biosynthesis bifunctional protein